MEKIGFGNLPICLFGNPEVLPIFHDYYSPVQHGRSLDQKVKNLGTKAYPWTIESFLDNKFNIRQFTHSSPLNSKNAELINIEGILKESNLRTFHEV